MLIACLSVAVGSAVQQHGLDMLFAFPAGFILQLGFGMLALLGAAEIAPRRLPARRYQFLFLGAGYALNELLHLAVDHWLIPGFLINLVLVTACLMLLFGWSGTRGVIVATLLTMLKIISRVVVEETLHQWFM
ncbi:MAG: hypothetical protein ACR2GY_03815 [Phycisphaerales bacterium]